MEFLIVLQFFVYVYVDVLLWIWHIWMGHCSSSITGRHVSRLPQEV